MIVFFTRDNREEGEGGGGVIHKRTCLKKVLLSVVLIGKTNMSFVSRDSVAERGGGGEWGEYEEDTEEKEKGGGEEGKIYPRDQIFLRNAHEVSRTDVESADGVRCRKSKWISRIQV